MIVKQNADLELLGTKITRLWEQGHRHEAVATASSANYAIRTSLGRHHPMYAAGLSSLARMYLDLGRNDEAEAELLECADITSVTSGLFTTAYAEALSHLAIVCQASGRDFDAENLTTAMHIVLGAALGSGPSEAQKKNIGNLHRALQTCRRSLQNQLGLSAERIYDYEEAEHHYRRATEYVVEEERTPQHACYLDNLAGLLRLKGAWPEAERIATEALSLFTTLLGTEHVDRLICMHGLGIIFEKQGKADEAIRLYQSGIQICRAAKGTLHFEQLKDIFATQLCALGQIYVEQSHNLMPGQVDVDAFQYYREAYELLRENPHSVEFAMLIARVAQVHYKGGALGSAYHLMEASSKIFAELGSDAHLHTNYLNSGKVAASLGMFNESEVKLQKALRWNVDHFGEMHLETAKCVSELVRLAALQGNRRAFISHVRRLKAIDDQLLQTVLPHATERDALLFAEGIWWRAEECIAGSAMLNLNDTNGLGEIYDLVLARKGIVLNVMIERGLAKASDGSPIIEFSANNSARLLSRLKPDQVLLDFVRVENSVLWPRNTKAFLFDLVLGPERQTGRDEVDSQSLFQTFNFANVDVSAVVPRYYCFVTSGDGRLSFVDVGSVPTVEKLIAEYVGKLGKEIAAGTENVLSLAGPAGRRLRRLVLDPILSTGSYSTIFILPDGNITSLPFDGLPTDDGHFLIDYFEVHYLHSFKDLLVARSVLCAGPSVVVGDPDYDMPSVAGSDGSDLQPLPIFYDRLPGSMLEAQTVAKLLGVAPLIGAEATKAKLLDVHGPQVLHLATHGAIWEGPRDARGDSSVNWSPSLANPLRRVGLVLAGANNQDRKTGILAGEDVLSMDLAGTDLVVLSACRSATGETRFGEGVLGLSRAFAVAGAANIVLSIWEAEDDETRELMILFYTARQKCETSYQALRHAKLRLRNLGRHPFFWSGFFIQGCITDG